MASSSNTDQDSEGMSSRLIEECEDVWLDINKLQAQLASSNGDGPVDAENPMMSISEIKIKSLKGQIAAENEKELSLLPTDPESLRALLREELETSVQQLEQTLKFVRGQRRELEEEVVWEKQVLNQQKQMQMTLEDKVAVARSSPQKSKNGLEADLNTTIDKSRKEIMRLLKELKTFSEKHFPHPDEEDSDTSDSEVLPLLDVLENFMNQSVETEGSPYIELDDTYWPPYTELMLRCGILQRHEHNANMLRLTPFHLKF